MNKGTLQRFYNDKVSFWKLNLWFEHPKIYFIAPPWNDNKPDISHIPAGLYNVTRENSLYHPNVFHILNVPNRTGILIHPGNYACDVVIGKELKESETKGCFMPGFDYDLKSPMIRNSVKTMEYLLDNIKENFALEVRIMLPPEEYN